MLEKQVLNNRQYDMDWIKVLATIAVFLYHNSMFFNPWPWHVKNNVIDTSGILTFSLFVGTWIMPIFFIVSGISVYYAFQKKQGKGYIRERLVRLGVPLLFGAIFLTAPQVYIERLSHGQFDGTFIEFLSQYFNGIYLEIGGTGNFAFFGLHLWYLFVLLIFTFLTLPLFKKIQGNKNFGIAHFFVLPLLLFVVGPVQILNLGGWDLLFYLLLFIYGYYFISSDSFKPMLRKTIRYHIGIAVISTSTYILWFMIGPPKPDSLADIFYYGVHTLSCWSLLLVIFFLADTYLSHTNGFLKYSSEASMPFYILHQPVIVIIGYLIKDFSWSVPVKLIFLVVVSFVIIMLCYHFIIRKVNVLRFLFGIKMTNAPKKILTNTSKSAH